MTKELKEKIDTILKNAPITIYKIHNLRDASFHERKYNKVDCRIKWFINGAGFVTAYDASVYIGCSYSQVAARCASTHSKWKEWIKVP